MGADESLSGAQELIDGLRDALRLRYVAIVKRDVEKQDNRVVVATCSGELDGPTTYVQSSPIKAGWSLYLLADEPFSRQADALIAWAVKKLASLLSDWYGAKSLSTESVDAPLPDRGGGGGSGPPAELAIPVWWIRKAQG